LLVDGAELLGLLEDGTELLGAEVAGITFPVNKPSGFAPARVPAVNLDPSEEETIVAQR